MFSRVYSVLLIVFAQAYHACLITWKNIGLDYPCGGVRLWQRWLILSRQADIVRGRRVNYICFRQRATVPCN